MPFDNKSVPSSSFKIAYVKRGRKMLTPTFTPHSGFQATTPALPVLQGQRSAQLPPPPGVLGVGDSDASHFSSSNPYQ